MDLAAFFRRQMPVVGAFALFFTAATLLLHAGICIEGGTILGFPWPFYTQCYGPPSLGQGPVLGPVEISGLGLALDIVFWYLVAAAFVYVVRGRRAGERP